MDVRLLLAKIITLVYKSRLIDSQDYDDLVRTMLSTIKTDNAESALMGKNSMASLKELCSSMLEEKDPIVKETLILNLSVVLENDQKLLQTIRDSIEPEQDEGTVKRVISSLVKYLNNYYREHLAVEIISKMSYDLKFARNKISNFGEYLKNALSELEPLTVAVSSIKDSAVVSEVDFEHPESIDAVFEEVKNLNNNTHVYKFGWHALNRMTQGGIRRGETMTLGALQHNYKSSMTLTLFSQIATLNKPIMLEQEIAANKKPLLLRISLEDNITSNLQFLYQYLKAVDGVIVKAKDFEHISAQEMREYILGKLTATGFHIKMLRIDPTQSSFAHIVNKVVELEAQGYAVHVLMIDYVTLLPTTGCTQGPTGSDKRDLLRRLRIFAGVRNIAFITPLQLSTEAKQLLRNGVPAHQLVKEIANKGYYDGSRTLDQEIDLELYIQLVTGPNKKKYLSVQRGKHRIPTVLENDEDLYFLLPFQYPGVPILEDIHQDDISFRALPRNVASSDESLLNDMLS